MSGFDFLFGRSGGHGVEAVGVGRILDKNGVRALYGAGGTHAAQPSPPRARRSCAGNVPFTAQVGLGQPRDHPPQSLEPDTGCRAIATIFNRRFAYLFLAIGKHGTPHAVRTDNEACFTSRVFRTVLRLTGIRQQRSDPGCLWQNGRIKRRFGKLKQKLDYLEVVSRDALDAALGEFRFWYNHIRPHQHLGGATPAETWAGVNPFAAKIKSEHWFEAWDGLLQGYYLRR